MRTIDLNGNKVTLYASIEEMPITDFQAYNRALLIDAGLGSTAEDLDSKLANAVRRLKRGDTKGAAQELENLRQTFAIVTSKTNPRMLAFAALVFSINGKEVKDKSDEGLREILRQLERRRVRVGSLLEALFEVKKKWTQSWRFFFRKARATQEK